MKRTASRVMFAGLMWLTTLATLVAIHTALGAYTRTVCWYATQPPAPHPPAHLHVPPATALIFGLAVALIGIDLARLDLRPPWEASVLMGGLVGILGYLMLILPLLGTSYP